MVSYCMGSFISSGCIACALLKASLHVEVQGKHGLDSDPNSGVRWPREAIRAFLARYSSRTAGISDLRSRPSCQLTRGLERTAMRFTGPAAPRCPLASSAMKRQFQLRAQSLQQARSTAPTQQTRQLRTPVKARCRRCESVREKAPCRGGRLAGVECSCSPQIPWSAELRGSPVV
jgi:hypothetical protein